MYKVFLLLIIILSSCTVNTPLNIDPVSNPEQIAETIKDWNAKAVFVSSYKTFIIDNNSKIWVAGDNSFNQYGVKAEDEIVFTKLEDLVGK